MMKKSKALVRAGLVSLAVFTVASGAQAAQQNQRSFTLAERQLLLIERMTNSALLAAFGIEVSPSLNSIHWSHKRFDKMQVELREGNPYSGLVPTTRPEPLENLGRVDVQWRQYNSIFSEIMTARSASKEQIGALTRAHEATVTELYKMVTSYEYYALGGRHHTMLTGTITGTGRLRAKTQRVLRGLMTVAYSEYGEEERTRLRGMVEDFDLFINGLIDGNFEQKLLPAANEEIRGELAKVQRMWLEIRPILQSTAAGNTVTKEHVVTVAKAANDMAVPLTMVLIMYMSI